MAVERYITAQDIINRAAIASGLSSVGDVFASTDPSFVQLRSLLTTCGQELVESYEWEYLRREHSIVTDAGTDDGTYPLPNDFGYMINQTGWDRTNDLPISGPLSAQQWSYLKGRDLASSTIYVSFRIMQNEFTVYPDNPVPDALTITFEYISRNWVIPISDPNSYEDKVQANGDIILFSPVMMVQYLRYKFLDAKGFDTQSALTAFTASYMKQTGRNKGAPILNAGGGRDRFPLLGYGNVPDTNYGL